MLRPRPPLHSSLFSTHLPSPLSPSPSSLLLLALTRLSLLPPPPTKPTTHTRPASHAAQGRANGPGDSAGRRLGAKKGNSELVTTGNIIFRQRGTHWFPGENCGMGRDHTIFALQRGYVQYYRDPETHPTRKFIGVVFERGMSLPRAKGAPRWRRLGMVVREMMGTVAAGGGEEGLEGAAAATGGLMGGEKTLTGGREKDVAQETRKGLPAAAAAKSELKLGPGYMYREANWEIGRAAERAKVKIMPYQAGNRFMAWRKRNARKQRNAERRVLRRKK
ncbi:54S ribosomal protein L2 mitochondrial [Loxospora ochrophaea]|nr:54S ribosomal protein L2 mitochondrial [Loxospora ochrophaea]